MAFAARAEQRQSCNSGRRNSKNLDQLVQAGFEFQMLCFCFIRAFPDAKMKSGPGNSRRNTIEFCNAIAAQISLSDAPTVIVWPRRTGSVFDSLM